MTNTHFHCIKSLCAITLFACVNAAAFGQVSNTETKRWWIAGGVGAGGTGDAGGVGLLGELVVQRNHTVFMVRGVGGYEFDLAGDSSGERDVGDVGVLIGRGTTGGPGHALIAAGVGGFSGACGDRTARCKSIPSIPLAVEAAIHIGPVVALGAQVLGNLNTRAPMIGGVVMLQVGWFGKRVK